MDDGDGNIMLVTSGASVGSSESVFNPSVGTINYMTGDVKLNDLIVTAFSGKAIKFTANSVRKDIKPPKDRIIVTRGEDVNVNVSPLEL